MKKNTKIVRLTENDLERMVRRIIKESDEQYPVGTRFKDTRSGKINVIVNYDNRGNVFMSDESIPGRKFQWSADELTNMVDSGRTVKINEEDFMDDDKEADLINDTYELLTDMGYEYVEDLYIQDLYEAAEILENELYDGNHGPHMNKEIEDLLTNIYEIIGYPDEAKDWDESEYY